MPFHTQHLRSDTWPLAEVSCSIRQSMVLGKISCYPDMTDLPETPTRTWPVPWTPKLLEAAGTRGGQPCNASSPAASTHWYLFSLITATPKETNYWIQSNWSHNGRYIPGMQEVTLVKKPRHHLVLLSCCEPHAVVECYGLNVRLSRRGSQVNDKTAE